MCLSSILPGFPVLVKSALPHLGSKCRILFISLKKLACIYVFNPAEIYFHIWYEMRLPLHFLSHELNVNYVKQVIISPNEMKCQLYYIFKIHKYKESIF